MKNSYLPHKLREAVLELLVELLEQLRAEAVDGGNDDLEGGGLG